MKKNKFFLYGVLPVLLFSACGTHTEVITVIVPEEVEHTDVKISTEVTDGGATSTSYGETAPVYPTRVEITDKRSAVLAKDQTYQIKAKVSPITAYQSELEYVSDDDNIATVSATGLITAKANGITHVTVRAKDDHNVQDKVQVVVANQTVSGPSGMQLDGKAITDLGTRLDDQLALQEQNYPHRIRKVRSIRSTESSLYSWNSRADYNAGKAATIESLDVSTEIFTADEDEGYFAIEGFGTEIITQDGSPSPAEFAWFFHVDDSYILSGYHNYKGVKNRASVGVQSYIGKPRYDVIIDLMAIFFRTSTNYAEAPSLWAKATSDFNNARNYGPLCPYGYYDDNNGVVGFTLEQFGYTYQEASEDESEDEIPAGTTVSSDIHIEDVWKDGHLISMDYYTINAYTINDVNGKSRYYHDVFRLNCTFEVDDEFDYELPDIADYSEVGDMFDL